MNSYKTPLIVIPLQDGKRWRLHEGFTYRCRTPGQGRGDNIIIQVPAGFITDFASVPKIFWSIIPAWGKFGKGAVVHDYLYQFTERTWLTRKMADQIFLGAMLISGTKAWKAKIMYWAVRLFGWIAWKGGL